MTVTLETTNIAARFVRMAEQMPDKRAIVAGGRTLSFRELNALSDRYAFALAGVGVKRGTRTVLMVTPGIDFFALTFALFKIGAVPVMVDPGMGVKNLAQCLKEAEPEVFIGIPKAHIARVLLGWGKPTLKVLVTVGPRLFWGGHTLASLPAHAGPYPLAETIASDVAAILFTSGSTGVPKGAVYTHGVFDTQVNFLRDHFGIQPDDIDLPTFPLFALFDAALGMTAIIPEMDATRPASVKPENILGPIREHGVTQMFGSPALLNTVGRAGAAQDMKLPTLRRVISAGAPVPPAVLGTFSAMLSPECQIHTPYGATEALPVASIGSHEILGETAARWAGGEGTCVGRPIEGVRLEIIRISDEPIAEWNDSLRVPDGEIGEIAVRGPIVTSAYFNRPHSDALAKMRDPQDGTVWHRMGDLGKRDADGRIWFQGRKAHRVETADGPLYTIPCEAIFNQHPLVYRTALVGVGPEGRKRPVICVEAEKGMMRIDPKALIEELRAFAAQHAHTRGIETFLNHPAFPVDIRHNAKIFREKLAVWAEEQLK